MPYSSSKCTTNDSSDAKEMDRSKDITTFCRSLFPPDYSLPVKRLPRGNNGVFPMASAVQLFFAEQRFLTFSRQTSNPDLIGEWRLRFALARAKAYRLKQFVSVCTSLASGRNGLTSGVKAKLGVLGAGKAAAR